MLALTAKTLYTPLDSIDRPVVLIEDGSVAKIGPQSATQISTGCKVHDFADCVLSPGLVDMHTHGAAGVDVMEADPDAQNRMENFLVRHGVTTYFPTTITAPMDKILASLERLANAIDKGATNAGRTQPIGIHIEGPFLSHARKGMHPAVDLQQPTLKAFNEMWDASRGHIRVMTIAPELDGALEVIAEASKRSVCVSIGHSDADIDQARKGVAAGGRHATHTFNAMRPLDHRKPGILGEVLTNGKLTAEVIADGIHVDPAVIKLVTLAKGIERTVLVTDATSATGMPDGKYMLGLCEIEVKDGMCTYQGTLAGSILTLDKAVRNVMAFANWDLQHALRAATLNPAKTAGAKNKGLLQPGADADLVVLTPAGEVKATVVRGQLVQ